MPFQAMSYVSNRCLMASVSSVCWLGFRTVLLWYPVGIAPFCRKKESRMADLRHRFIIQALMVLTM